MLKHTNWVFKEFHKNKIAMKIRARSYRNSRESSANFARRHIDDVFSIHILDIESYLGKMFPFELVINDRGESHTFAFFYFPNTSNSILSSTAKGVFIQQPTRYVSACSTYGCLMLRVTQFLLASKASISIKALEFVEVL